MNGCLTCLTANLETKWKPGVGGRIGDGWTKVVQKSKEMVG